MIFGKHNTLFVLLLACVLLAPPAHSEEAAVFDPSPEHAWDRLYSALHTNAPFEREKGDELEEQLLTGEPYKSMLAALDGFLTRRADKAFSDPVKRALLQSDIWGTFDLVADATGRFQANRKEIARRCAEIIRRLSLTDAEVAGLPDNFAAAVKSGVFPTDYDPDHRERMFLPPDLLDENGPWVQMSGRTLEPAAIRHVEAVQGRSVFHVLIRLPGGRSDTLAYLGKLADFPQPYIWNEYYAPYPYARSPVALNPALPQFPQGTQVALLRRMVLPNAKGELAVSPITESVQIRVYRRDPKSASPGDSENQAFYEAELAREELLEGTAGLRVNARPQTTRRLLFEKPTMFSPPAGCSNCHGQVGVFSLQTYARTFGPPRGSPWFEPSRMTYQNENTLNWKKGDYTWGLLRGLLDAR